jgi:hypothetical protein
MMHDGGDGLRAARQGPRRSSRDIRVVALDLPTSWMMTKAADEFTSRRRASASPFQL